MKALVGAFNQEKALVGAFSVIVQPVVEPTDRFAALLLFDNTLLRMAGWAGFYLSNVSHYFMMDWRRYLGPIGGSSEGLV